MIQLQKALQERLQTELDKNTQGLDFEVSLYSVKTNSLLENQLPVEDTYATQQKRFIPVIIEDISGDYADLTDLTAIEANINTSILIPVDSTDFNNMVIDETFETVAEALDTFIQRNLTKKLPLGDTEYVISDEYKFDIDLSELPSSVYFKYDFKFVDNSEGELLLLQFNDVTFKITKTQDEILLYEDDTIVYQENYSLNQTFSIAYQEQITTQRFWINKNIDETPDYSVNEGSTKQLIRFGGCYCRPVEFGVYGSPTSQIVKINNFLTFDDQLGYVEIFENKEITAVSETGSLGHVTLGFSLPNPTTNQFTFGNGLNYQQYELNMRAFVSDKVFVGQEVKYYLNDLQIFPFYRDEGFTSDMDPAQIISKQVTKFTASQSVLNKEFSVYYTEKKIFKDLLKKITSETLNPNEVFKFKIQYPLFTQEYDVIISQGGTNITNNMPIAISLKFDLADSILLT